MKRVEKTLLVFLITAIFCVPVFADESQPWRFVQVQDGQLRDRPSFLGKIVGGLIYGERVRVVEEVPGWSRVELPGGLQGWIHGDALTTKTIVLKTGSRHVEQTATTDEIALAGKGFNEAVENQFRADNPNLDYAWVDRMQTYTVTPDRMRAFLEEGGLQSPGENP